jgi:hypothetical protein
MPFDLSDRFVVSVDIADGAGRDFSVINIFKVLPMSLASIRRLRRDRVEDETSGMRLVQVGVFRSNKAGADELSKIAEVLIFKLLGHDLTRVALEMNFKGDYFIEKISKNPEYYDQIFLHTRHNDRSQKTSLGIKLHKHNKMFFCREFRKLVMEKRVVLNEQVTFDEMNDFGINPNGTYSSQSGHDDVAMTTIYTSPFTGSDDFSFVIEEIVDQTSENFKKQMYNILEAEKNSESGNFSMLKEFM